MPNITKPIGLNNIWAEGGTKIDPGASKVNIGWVVQLPPYEFQNWVDNRQDRAIAHINQHGIPEWDSVTEYQGLLSYAQGSDGKIYKCLQTNTNKDPANSLNSTYWTRAFEDFGSVAVVQAALASHLTDYQTLANIGNTAAARANLSVYSKLDSDSRFSSLNGSSSQVFSVAPATQPEHAVRLGQVSSLLTQATEATLGVVRLATVGLTDGGVDDATAITPLKANTVYLKKSGNLAGLSNISTARSNLGLGSMATQSTADFLSVAGNLSEVPNQAIARSNLGITNTATRPETYFLRSGQNLADLTNVASARSNLGLTSLATTDSSLVMLKSDNLFGLASVESARTNLGLGSSSTKSDSYFLQTGNNLSDLQNKQTSRNNLGLGGAATLDVFGLTQAALDFTSVKTNPGYFTLPNGIIVQWGFGTTNGGTSVTATFPKPFPNGFLAATTCHGTNGEVFGTGYGTATQTTIVLRIAAAGNSTIRYIAIGW